MKIVDLIHSGCVFVKQNKMTKQKAIDTAIHSLELSGVLSDVNTFREGVYKREKEFSTNVGGGIAIPHCKSDVVKKPALAALTFTEGIDFDSEEPVELMFLIAAPHSEDNVHLDVLAKLSQMLMHPEFKAQLMQSKTNEEFMACVVQAEQAYGSALSEKDVSGSKTGTNKGSASLSNKGPASVSDKGESIKVATGANNAASGEGKSSLASINNSASKEAKSSRESTNNAASDNTYPTLLAVTSCPTGIAHTYMAQEAMEEVAKRLGVSIKVETNGSGGAKNVLTDEEIENAECIIVAADAFVEMSRFNGKRVLECPVSDAIKKPETLIKEALGGSVPVYGKAEMRKTNNTVKSASRGHILYKHLMSGISHMIPFVVAGGILLAIAYMIDGLSGVPKEGATIDGIAYAFGSVSVAARVFHDLGGTLGLGLMFPILGGFIAYSIAGKPALVSGFVGSFAATKGTYSLLYFIVVATEGPTSDYAKMLASSSAGFIGAIFAGFISGYSVLFLIRKLDNMPRTMQGIRDMMLIPLLSTFFIGMVMLLLNVPFGYINIGLSGMLSAMQSAGLIIVLAAVVSGLMATDMGGPINKASHYFVLGLVTTALEAGASPEFQTVAFQLMAANIVGIMTPPVGVSICIWLFPQKFTEVERRPVLANVITGCCGITEGVIPYLAADFVRVLIACVSGAAIGGALSMLLGMEAIAPEGGTISFLVMGSICWRGLVAMLVGSCVTAFILGALKRDVLPEAAKLGKWKGIPLGPKYKEGSGSGEEREIISLF